MALNRRAIFARDGHRCQYCGAQAENIDHIVPRSKGGPALVGQRRRRLPALQRPQAGPPAGRDRDEAAPPAVHASRQGVGVGRAWRRPPDWEPYLGFPGQVVPLTVAEEGAAALSA